MHATQITAGGDYDSPAGNHQHAFTSPVVVGPEGVTRQTRQPEPVEKHDQPFLGARLGHSVLVNHKWDQVHLSSEHRSNLGLFSCPSGFV